MTELHRRSIVRLRSVQITYHKQTHVADESSIQYVQVSHYTRLQAQQYGLTEQVMHLRSVGVERSAPTPIWHRINRAIIVL